MNVALVTLRREDAAWATHVGQIFSLGISDVKESQCVFLKQVKEALKERSMGPNRLHVLP